MSDFAAYPIKNAVVMAPETFHCIRIGKCRLKLQIRAKD